jgi:uncharacterized protein YoxC
MDASNIAVISLLAVFVGMTIPVLIQLTLTLRSARNVLDSSGKKLDRALDEITTATQRVNRVGAGLEESVQKIRDVVDTVSSLGESVTRLRDSIQTAAAIGNAVGPAVAAALRAFWERPSNGGPKIKTPTETEKETENPSQDTGDETETQEEAR